MMSISFAGISRRFMLKRRRDRTSPQVGLNERKNIILQKANGLLSEDESIMKKSIESTMHSYDPNVTGSKD